MNSSRFAVACGLAAFSPLTFRSAAGVTPAAGRSADGTVTQKVIEFTVTRAIPAGTPRLCFGAREQ